MNPEEVQTLPAALSWLRTAWSSLPVAPNRTHIREVSLTEDKRRAGCACLYCTTKDPGEGNIAPQFSGPMWRIITGHPTDEYDVTESVMCGHPRLRSESIFDCPDCQGDGHYEHRVRRYRSPMSAALFRLSKAPAPSIGTPAPIEYIIALYLADWDLWKAAASLHLEPISSDHERTIEAMFLMAVRALHSRYSAGPVARIGWVDKSDAQRNAEDAA